jgi:hypothetical protein
MSRITVAFLHWRAPDWVPMLIEESAFGRAD